MHKSSLTPNKNKNKTSQHLITLPETNIAPENAWLEYYGILVSVSDGLVSGAFAVSFREGRHCVPRILISSP